MSKIGLKVREIHKYRKLLTDQGTRHTLFGSKRKQEKKTQRSIKINLVYGL